ncbi:hypothetical protein JW868_00455, partial [Candidatus Woesearchaeota archaeon]|nr:hypothetical protein [Candidatus Woesearchaeota archaeon]
MKKDMTDEDLDGEIKESSEDSEAKKLAFPMDYYQFDASGMKKRLDGVVETIRKARELGSNLRFEKQFSRIIYCGMGGSAISGELLKIYAGESIPLFVFKDYDIPLTLGKEDLVICSSYSGNTEETISCYKQANRSQATVVSMSTSGKIKELCELNRTTHIALPKGFEPRNAWPLQFFCTLNILVQAGFAKADDSEIKSLVTNIQPQKFDEIGQKFSEKLEGKVPIIYATRKWETLAYRWKTSINENSKVLAFHHYFPELDHNEIVGYTKMLGKFALIVIRFDDD